MPNAAGAGIEESRAADPTAAVGAPGRTCPSHYRYRPQDLARSRDFEAETLYIVGGLYGNRPALAALTALAAGETRAPTIVFNGDFNWFNVDAAGFEAINREVLRHAALRGNVETELAGEDSTAGCGCGYPAWVGDAEVARSNAILERLAAASRQFPGLRQALAALPMHLVAEVGGVRTAIVHGDAHALAGWDYAQERLADIAHVQHIGHDFEAARVRIIASSHTCLPVLAICRTAAGDSALINNGAAGMPNFAHSHHGIITRISVHAPHPDALYGTRVDRIHIEALPLRYDHRSWLDQFRQNWPQGSPAHASYWRRITEGPAYEPAQAIRRLPTG